MGPTHIKSLASKSQDATAGGKGSNGLVNKNLHEIGKLDPC